MGKKEKLHSLEAAVTLLRVAIESYSSCVVLQKTSIGEIRPKSLEGMGNAVVFISGIAVMSIHNFDHPHSFCSNRIYCNGWMDIYCAVLYRVGRWHC